MQGDNIPKFTAEELATAISLGGPNFALKQMRDSFDKALTKTILLYLYSNRCFNPSFHGNDIFQDTWVAVLTRLKRYSDGIIESDIKYPFRWVCTISTNKCIKHFNNCRNSKFVSIDDDVSCKAFDRTVKSPEAQLITKLDAQLVWRYINELPHDFQQALKFQNEDYTHEEIASETGMTVAKSKADRWRAIKRLKEELKKAGISNGDL